MVLAVAAFFVKRRVNSAPYGVDLGLPSVYSWFRRKKTKTGTIRSKVEMSLLEQHPFVNGMFQAHCVECGIYDNDWEVEPPADFLCEECDPKAMGEF